MKPQRGTTEIVFSLTWALERGWVFKATPRPLYPRERNPVSDAQEAGWDSRLVWTGVENLAPTGIRYRELPTRRNSLYLPKEIITGKSETHTTGGKKSDWESLRYLMSYICQHNSKLRPTRWNVSWFIYFYRRSTCFRLFLRPSSGANNCTYSFKYCQPILLLAAIVDEMELQGVQSHLSDALHVSGGSSAHHQEHITVHTASGFVNQYRC